MTLALRLMTYNIRNGRGADGRVDLGRIADVIAAYAPDVIALQEVDVGRARSGRRDQAQELARRLGMGEVHFAAGVVYGEAERYGIATLSRLPIGDVRRLRLPGAPDSEPRSALYTRVAWPAGELALVQTHLALTRRERLLQVGAIAEAFAGPELVVAGDLNCTPVSAAYRALRAKMSGRSGRARTWPARLPLFALDHVLWRGPFVAVESGALGGPLARRASDHLPVFATLVRAAGESS